MNFSFFYSAVKVAESVSFSWRDETLTRSATGNPSPKFMTTPGNFYFDPALTAVPPYLEPIFP